MRVEEAITAFWAAQVAESAVRDTINRLEKMGRESMQSGDDSGLRNVWEEICDQVQTQYSVFWAIYEETMEGFLYEYVDALDRRSKLAIWSTTEEGWDWIYDHHADPDGESSAPFDIDAVVQKLKGALLAAAADYEFHDRRFDEVDSDDCSMF